MYLVECWIEHQVLSLDKVFTYTYDKPIIKGVRVVINFNHKEIIGFVENCIKLEESIQSYEEKVGYKIKPINRVLDEEALITNELHELGKWMANQTITSTISCFQTMLPSKVKPVSNSEKIIKVKFVKVIGDDTNLTKKQLEVYNYVKENKEVLQSELNKKYPGYCRTLIKLNKLEVFEVIKSGSLKQLEVSKDEFLPLNNTQSLAMEKIINSNKKTILLHGVTGSGKTEVYLHLSRQVIETGKQVLILVPEISLTPQMVKRVKSRFNDDVAIYHSNLSSQEKYEQYRRVLKKEIKVVVGTRSAVFMPFCNLGLIIMDEEHDLSYKQDNNPSYHCRDIAIKRAESFDCKVLLGSATPSLESYARALKDVYELVELPTRVNDKLPSIQLVNINTSIRQNKSYIITNVLKEKIQDRLNKNEQTILLLNRRGFTTSLKCSNCNSVIMCNHCDLAMSYHHDIKMMKCHTCNATKPVFNVCPVCKATRSYSGFGFGTQRLEAEIRENFPEARILRMDSDTTSRKNSHERILEDFSNHKADILVGTQMISKGLDYPLVSLVGILNGDAGLSRNDYRSQELTFDLLVQASGRSGRSDINGEVIIQVYDEYNHVIQAALKQDYKSFFKSEMAYRKAGGYPPYNYLIALIFYGRNKDVVNDDAHLFLNKLVGDFKVLGPSELLKISDQYRTRIIMKGKSLDEMREVVRIAFNTSSLKSKLKIDINPLLLD